MDTIKIPSSTENYPALVELLPMSELETSGVKSCIMVKAGKAYATDCKRLMQTPLPCPELIPDGVYEAEKTTTGLFLTQLPDTKFPSIERLFLNTAELTPLCTILKSPNSNHNGISLVYSWVAQVLPKGNAINFWFFMDIPEGEYSVYQAKPGNPISFNAGEKIILIMPLVK